MSEAQSAARLLNPLAFNLQKLGLELKCPVCLNLLRNPVLLPCNHVFCDFCVPKTHQVTAECPACRQGFTDQGIRPASHLDNIVTIYKNLNATFNSAIFPLISSVADKVPKEDNKHYDDSLAIKAKVDAFTLIKCPSSDELEVLHPMESSPSSGVAEGVKCDVGDPGSKNASMEKNEIKRSAAGHSVIAAERTEDQCHTRESKRQKRLSYGSSEVSSVANIDAPEGQNQAVCAFCHRSKTTEGTGTLLHYADGKAVSEGEVAYFNSIPVHSKCIEWAPQVYYVGETVKNLEAELARASKLKCTGCGLKGAALGCFANSCRKTYHVPCALEIPGCRWDCNDFVMLCPTHKSIKFPSEKSGARKHRPVEKSFPSNQISSKELEFWSTTQATEPREWAFCGSALSSKEKSLLVKFGAICGATVHNSWNPNVTHVIAATDANGACSRTYKVLIAILSGKWILTMEWVKACVEANHPVLEEPYEVYLDNHGCYGGPKAGRLRASYDGPKLFDDMSFYFHGDFSTNYKNDLLDLVRAGGGTVVEWLEQKENRSIYVVYYCNFPPHVHAREENSAVLNRRAEEAKNVATDIGARVVPHTWILESIAACRVLTTV